MPSMVCFRGNWVCFASIFSLVNAEMLVQWCRTDEIACCGAELQRGGRVERRQRRRRDGRARFGTVKARCAVARLIRRCLDGSSCGGLAHSSMEEQGRGRPSSPLARSPPTSSSPLPKLSAAAVPLSPSLPELWWRLLLLTPQRPYPAPSLSPFLLTARTNDGRAGPAPGRQIPEPYARAGFGAPRLLRFASGAFSVPRCGEFFHYLALEDRLQHTSASSVIPISIFDTYFTGLT